MSRRGHFQESLSGLEHTRPSVIAALPSVQPHCNDGGGRPLIRASLPWKRDNPREVIVSDMIIHDFAINRSFISADSPRTKTLSYRNAARAI